MGADHTFKTFTTLHVGGEIRSLVRAHSEHELVEALSQEDGEFFILGGGSNVLAPDDEYTGTVYMPLLSDVSYDVQGDSIVVTAGAGVTWDALVAETVSRGMWGFENLSGIPGTVGGAVFQNIGAYGAVLSNTLSSVRVLDMHEKRIHEFSQDACQFGYRTSIFKSHAPRYVILSALFVLKQHGEPNIAYKDLAIQFANDPQPRLSAIRTAVLSIRKNKFPNLAEYGTAGSFFLNPVVPFKEAEALQHIYPDMPLFPLPEGGVKVPLAWILDHVVKVKDMRVGGAFVWPQHALVIATEPNARARDVQTLATRIQEKVFHKTNMHIVPEVRVL